MTIKPTRRRVHTKQPQAPTLLPLSAAGRLRRIALLSGMGCTIVALSLDPHVVRADGPAFGSPAWAASRMPAGSNSGAPPVASAGGNLAAGFTGTLTPDAAAQRATRSMADLSAAAQKLATALAAQASAAQAARAGTQVTVPDGLAPGGLVPDSGLSGSGAANPVTSWVNLKAPVQGREGAATLVTVEQTDAKAIANWQSFNVGANTKLHFDQHRGTQTDGSNNWIVFNRITDATLNPSRILGQISAEGSVYLLNNSGFIFGAGSVVDTHSLLASTLNLFSSDRGVGNSVFLSSQGIAQFTAPPEAGNSTGIRPILLDPGTAAGNITVEAGATISTEPLGYSLLAAPNVTNAGLIRADDGQAMLVAARNVALAPSPVNSTVASAQIKPYAFVPGGMTPVTQVVNSGVIEAERGSVTMVGLDNQQNGVVAVTTDITHPGTVALTDGVLVDGSAGSGGGRVLFGENSLTAVMPDASLATTPASSVANFVTGSVTVAASSATFGRGSQLEAPGANLRLSLANGGSSTAYGISGRAYLDVDAVIDLAGLADVLPPAGGGPLVTIPRIGQNELADSPVQRDGFLFKLTNVVIDSTVTGTRSDGTSWIGSPILNAAGYANQVPQTIAELLTRGGTFSLKSNGGEFISAAGSFINLDGGYVRDAAGQNLGSTRLVTDDGHLFSIARADPLYTYSGLAGSYTVAQSRFGISDTWVDPIVSGKAGAPLAESIVGGTAGALLLGEAGVAGVDGSRKGLSEVLIAGTLSAQAFAGRAQVLAGKLPDGGTLSITSDSALRVEDHPVDLTAIAAGFGAATPVTVSAYAPQDERNLQVWNPLDGTALSAAGFGRVTLDAAQVHVVSGGLTVQQGGTISLSGGRVVVDANLTATSGRIALTSGTQGTGSISFVDPESTANPVRSDLIVGSGVTLSTAGRFVNDYGLGPDQQQGSGALNGGSIVLAADATTGTAQRSATPPPRRGDPPPLPVYDTTGAIILAAGSTLDVSGGGYVRPDGSVLSANGLALGSGGNVSILSYPILSAEAIPGRINPATNASTGSIQLDGRILGYGFSGGGTFALRALNLAIGADPARAGDPSGFTLPTNFFADQGFANYQLSTPWDATIASGATVQISHRNFVADPSALRRLATGSDLYASAATPLGFLDAFHRAPTNLSISAGDYLSNPALPPQNPAISGSFTLGAGASILADAGAAVRLGAFNQVTVLGSIVARGGSITLSGDTAVGSDANGGYAPPPTPARGGGTTTSTAKSVWLGAGSLLDVSGIALIDPLAAASGHDGQLATQPITGKLLNGGSITLSNDSGYVVAERGAQLEASGTSASFDLIAATGSAQPGQGYATTPTAVWSDGGTITLAAGGGLLFDGSLHAAGGAAGGSGGARGGTLKIVGLNNGGGPVTRNGHIIGTTQVQATAVVLRQSGDFVPNGLQPGDEIESGSALGAPSGTLHFAADRITSAVDRTSGATIASGIANLVIGADPSAKLLAPQNSSAPLTLDFSGPIKLSLPGSIALNVAQLRARQAGDLVYGPDDPSSIGAPAISIGGGYLTLAGNSYGGRAPLDLGAHVNDATLTLTGTHGLDISGTVALQNFASSSFATNGDLRFVTAAAANLDSTGLAASSGLLYSPGDLAFSAARVYPASGQSFAIVAANPSADTRISFTRAPGSSGEATPLSAGGRLLVDATSIDQGGALYAPYGTLQLGIASSGVVAPSSADPAYTKLPFDAATLNLVGTRTLKLAAGGLTSVSGGDLTIPYGTTVDGQSLQVDVVHDAQLPASAVVAAAPPAKRLALGAASITLAKGATVDLSGGTGELQAQEFVPGTGGTRDVLATTGNNSSALFPDGRAVYAIIPGQNSANGAYDPALDSSGAGPLIGRSVHLSGIAGLADGDYVLLPARYATLPGAFRVVENSANSDALAARNLVLPDGSYLSAGYFVDAVTGARDARSSSFLVQSDAVWQQYSQYTLTSAADYYTAQAAKQGTALPQLPLDAGQLSLAALSSLKFGATVDSAGGTLLKDDGTARAQGSGAQVDIAARDIQVLAANSAALDGYVQVAAGDLESLHAGSLLLGGTRRTTTSGIAIDTVATSVVIGDSGATGKGAAILSGPELILATHADATDTKALSQGVMLGAGSALDAEGAAQSRAQAITVAGDGTLLRLSTSGPVALTRSGASDGAGSGGGGAVLSLGKGASIDGLADAANPAALTLDSSGDIKLADDASFRARAIDLGAASASFVSATVDSDGIGGLVLAPALLAQLASAEQLSIRARDGIRFVNAALLDAAGKPLKNADGQPRYEALDVALQGKVSLTAPLITAGAGAVSLSVAAIMDSAGKTLQPGLLRFDGGTGTAATAGSGSLSLSADQLQFGDGGATFSGLKTFVATARERVLGSGTAPVDFGAADVGFRTPLMTVATAANLSLTTTGSMTVAGTGVAAGSSNGLGGRIALSGEDLAVSTAVVAHAGLIALDASGVQTLREGAATPTDFVHHDLSLGAGALLDVSGVALEYFDVARYAPGGSIRLNTVDRLSLAAASRFAFGGAAGGGDAGSLSIAALSDTRTLASFGKLNGAAAAGGQGGSLALDLGGGADLNALADALHGAGVTQSVALHTRAGNLALASGKTISAGEIALTADADGKALGAGDGNITIDGTLDASGVKGGSIALSGATGADISGKLLARGSSASERGGTVRIATGDRGDPTQTGGTYGNETIGSEQSGAIRIASTALIDVSGGKAGGLSGGTIAFRAPLLSDGGLRLEINKPSGLLGSRETSIEAYAIWDAASGSGFTGAVDPAGNAAFFGNTLGGFVSQGPFAFEGNYASIANLAIRPGIELRNSAGDISVVSNWNLGAVTLDGNGQVASHVYRHGDLAPVVTLRASGNVNVNASISDGFVQIANPLGLQAPNPSTQARAQALYAILASAYPELAAKIDAPASFGSGADAGQVAQYYGLYEQYLDYLLYAKLPLGALATRPRIDAAPATRIETQGIARLPIGAPIATNNPQGYAGYLVQYEAYLEKREDAKLITRVALPAPPPTRLVPVFTSAAIGAPVDNSISPQATASNPLPLASATLAGGDSSSIRIVAGAATASADPLATRATAGNDVVLGGSTNYNDALTGNTIYTPTMIRTGSGAISVAAARDVALADPTAPGVIYTAGVPAAGRSVGQQSSLLQTALTIGGPDDTIVASPSGEYLVTGAVQPEGAGDLAISAGRDLVGAQAAFSTNGNAGQAWWQWLQTGNEARYSLDGQHNGGNGLVAGGIAGITASSINYGAFGQGLLSAGGDVRLSAGHDIRNLSVSLPSTWYLDSDANGKGTVNTVGGGDLRVLAGGDILSGSYFVARGSGRIAAGGDIASDLQFQSSDVGTLLAVQDGSLAVSARGKVAIGGVYDPAYLSAGLPAPLFSAESTPYSATSSVAITAVSGAFRFGTLGLANRDEQGYFGTGLALGSGGTLQYSAAILPASLSLEALGADLSIERSGELYPSAVGNLGLYANGSILLASNASLRSILEGTPDLLANGQDRYFGMIDADPASLPSQLNQPDARLLANLSPALQRSYRYISAQPNAVLHARHALHADDHEASRVYALHGDLVSGVVGDDGVLRDALVLAPDEQARIKAGRDIVNLSFLGQQIHDADLSVIAAGRDLYDTPGGTSQTTALLGSEPSLQIGGPGALLVEAGRDIGPLANQNQVVLARQAALASDPPTIDNLGSAPVTGIVATGNNGNPYLPRRSADINLLFGIGPGVAQDAFIAKYLNPAVGAVSGLPSYVSEMVNFVRRRQAGLAVDTGFVVDQAVPPAALSPAAAYAAFRAMPEDVQRLLVAQVFSEILTKVGNDAAAPGPYSARYGRGYEAIATLFPDSLGYTRNRSEAEVLTPTGQRRIGVDGEIIPWGSENPIETGSLDLRGTTVQTQQGGPICGGAAEACTKGAALGGNITLLGPGGNALIGSTAAPSVLRDANGNIFAGPGSQGLLALQEGGIRVFTDRSLLLAQSRVFTEGGGDLSIWSSNGDINAGRGARTTADTPAPTYLCNPDDYCTVDARGAVTGAGIATLQIDPRAKSGNVYLIAPAGTVDAGDAGIRVSGNLVIAAAAVANADNVQVQGSAIGLHATVVDSGTLAAGSSAAAAAQSQAQSLAARPVDRAATVIMVEVYGFGAPDEEQKKKLLRQ